MSTVLTDMDMELALAGQDPRPQAKNDEGTPHREDTTSLN